MKPRRRYGNRHYNREWIGPILVAVATFCGLSALGYSVASSALAANEPAMPSVREVVASVQDVAGAPQVDKSSPARELSQPAKRQAAAPTQAPARPSSPAASVPFQEAPPVAAPPVTRLRGAVPTGNAAAFGSNSPPAGKDRFAVSVVADPGSGLDEFGRQVVAGLGRRGLEAKLVTLDDAGRPDALLVLGRSGEKHPAAWFCDPGPQGGNTLSKVLLDSMAGLPPDAAGVEPAASGHGPTTAFPCADIGAGRARVAASLLELPAGVINRPELRLAAGDDIVTGLTRYFGENGQTVRSARAATRLVWPAMGPITSYFGPSHPLGIDVAQDRGNVVAAMAGTVVFSGGNACCSYGLYVVVDSPDGVRTLYAHLSSLAVKRGQKVRQGQTLGKVGSTGTSTGTHLHFEVMDRGVRQDPLRYLP